MKLAEKIQAIANEISIDKDLNVSTGKSGSYKAIGEAQIKNKVKPREAEYKISIIPTIELVGEPQIIEKKKVFNGNEQITHNTSVFVKCILTVYDLESDETLTSTAFGQGIDSGDKALGKANTYALKYALMNLFKMSTGEDEDFDNAKKIKETKSMQQIVTTLFNEKLEKYDDKNALYKEMGITGKAFIEDYKSGDFGKLESLKGLLEMS